MLLAACSEDSGPIVICMCFFHIFIFIYIESEYFCCIVATIVTTVHIVSVCCS